MHPTITHQLSSLNQQAILDRAAADRLARLATAGRPSPLQRVMATLRRRPTIARPAPTAEPRSASGARA